MMQGPLHTGGGPSLTYVCFRRAISPLLELISGSGDASSSITESIRRARFASAAESRRFMAMARSSVSADAGAAWHSAFTALSTANLGIGAMGLDGRRARHRPASSPLTEDAGRTVSVPGSRAILYRPSLRRSLTCVNRTATMRKGNGRGRPLSRFSFEKRDVGFELRNSCGLARNIC